MSTSAPTESPESKELSLVGKVELRIALVDSDTKLESILKTYLPPLLLKLASDYISVRNKVRQQPICTEIRRSSGRGIHIFGSPRLMRLHDSASLI